MLGVTCGGRRRCGSPLSVVCCRPPSTSEGGWYTAAWVKRIFWPSLLAFGSHTDPTDRVPAGPAGTVLTSAGQARRDRIIAHAFDLGVNMLDIYADMGQWEPAARFLRGRRDKVLVSLAHEISARKDRLWLLALRARGLCTAFILPTLTDRAMQNWDVLRKAKEAGKIRAIGIASHDERTMYEALTQLEGIDYLFLPYNFIQARAGYSQFLPEAQRRGVGHRRHETPGFRFHHEARSAGPPGGEGRIRFPGLAGKMTSLFWRAAVAELHENVPEAPTTPSPSAPAPSAAA